MAKICRRGVGGSIDSPAVGGALALVALPLAPSLRVRATVLLPAHADASLPCVFGHLHRSTTLLLSHPLTLAIPTRGTTTTLSWSPTCPHRSPLSVTPRQNSLDHPCGARVVTYERETTRCLIGMSSSDDFSRTCRFESSQIFERREWLHPSIPQPNTGQNKIALFHPSTSFNQTHPKCLPLEIVQ
jgi:hypothetical protein